MTPDALSPALEAVLARFARMVQSIGWRHGLTAADFDELIQDVRIRLWRALESGEQIAAVPSSYVYRTTLSAAADLVRRRRRQREEPLTPDRPSGEARLGVAPAADAALGQEEALAAIERAIGTLSDSRRPVVRLFLAGYRREEIAGLMGWSEAKTRNLLYRGMDDLRSRLTELGLAPMEGER